MNNKLIQIGEHNYFLPSLPKSKEEILFSSKKKEDAFWDRDILIKSYKSVWFDFIPHHTKLNQSATLYDQDGILISLNEEDSNYIIRIYEQEMFRRRNGVWFKNCEDFEYITGDHYFILMWCKTKRPDKISEYFDYYEYQRDYAYLINYTNKSKHINGLFTSKAKKTGVTNFHWLYYLNKATMSKNINLGNMNIDQDKGAKTFRDHFLYAYNGLPAAFKPKWKSKSEMEGRITFGQQYRNSKKGNLNPNDSEDELNTSVMCVPTMPNAFDVDVFEDIWWDEAPKYKQDFGGIYRSNMAGTSIQDELIGKIWITSYTPEENSDSFDSAGKLFFESELKTITEFSEGRTKSKLICHHIPASASWKTSIDKYGRCDVLKAQDKIQFLRDGAKGDKKMLQTIIRQYANNKREAWSKGGYSSIFDPIRLGELIYELDLLLMTGKIFEQGKLEWNTPLWEAGRKDKRPKGNYGTGAHFVPLTKDEIAKGEKGRLVIYEPMPAAYENMALKQGKDEFGNLLPPPKFKNVGGIDPTDFRDTGNAADGSFDSMYVMPVHDEIVNIVNRKPVTKIILAEYLDRPDNPEEFYQDVVKFIIYFGCLVIVEGNNGWLATRLEEEGLGHYMLFKNEDGVLCFYKANHNKTLKHIRTLKSGNVDTVADLILLIKVYLQAGNISLGEIDYGKLIKAMRLLMQLKDFDANDTKRFDTVISFGYTLQAHETYIALSTMPEEELYQASKIQCVANALFNNF